MRRFKKLGISIITAILVLGILSSNLTLVTAEEDDVKITIEDLQELYNDRKQIERGTYTQASWDYFQDALQQAKMVLANPDEVDQSGLEFVYEFLAVSKPFEDDKHDGNDPDFSALEQTYNEYKDIEQGDYNEPSWENFQYYLQEAYKTLYEYTYLTQNYVDQRLYWLEDSYIQLEEGEPNIAKLEAIYDEYKDIEQGDYIKGTWSPFEHNLNRIKNSLETQREGESLTNHFIDYLIDELIKSYNELETSIPDLTELQDAFIQFEEEYGNINPEKTFTDSDDIELYEYVMEFIPELIDDPEYATQKEVNEFLQNLAELREKIEHPNKDDDEIEDDGSSNNNDDDEKDNNNSDNNSNEDDDGKTDDSSKNDNDNKIKDDSSTENKDKEDDESFQNDDNDEEDKSSTNDDDKKDGSSPNKDGEDNVTTTVSDNDDSNNTFKEAVQKHILPDTASDHYNTIVSGMILIVVGSFLYVYYSLYSFVRKRFN